MQLCRVWRCSQWRMLREKGSWDSYLTSTTSTEMVSFATVSCTRWGDDDYDLWNFYIQVLKMMVGSNLKEDQLQQIVDKTILQVRTSDHSYLKWQLVIIHTLCGNKRSFILVCNVILQFISLLVLYFNDHTTEFLLQKSYFSDAWQYFWCSSFLNMIND